MGFLLPCAMQSATHLTLLPQIGGTVLSDTSQSLDKQHPTLSLSGGSHAPHCLVQTVFKAHEGAVHALQLCQLSSGSALPGPLCLVTSGNVFSMEFYMHFFPRLMGMLVELLTFEKDFMTA